MEDIQDLVLKPVRIASSKQAQHTYINTILLVSGSVSLFGLAIIAYLLLYMSIPPVGFEKVVHLQFSEGLNPYGFVFLDGSISPQQTYDIRLELDLPRSPPNIDAGNFMLDMAMLSPTYTPLTQYFEKPLDYRREVPQDALLFSSRRPAILKYEPRLVRLARLLTTLPWHVSGWQREAEKLEISMAEGVSFKKGWRNVPTTVYLELDGRGQDMQVYHLNFKLRARYEGLRWLMYNHRVFSFIVFTTAFWAGEVIFAVLAWALWSARSGEQKPAGDVKKESGDSESAIKAEPDTEDVETDDVDLSDTPRTFPTYGRQAPLHYVPKAKSEGAEVRVKVEPVPLPLPVGAEGDDESEIPISVQSYRGGRSDSGIGTSFSEAGTSREGVQRRRSKGRGD